MAKEDSEKVLRQKAEKFLSEKIAEGHDKDVLNHDLKVHQVRLAYLRRVRSGGFAEADQNPALFIPEIEPH